MWFGKKAVTADGASLHSLMQRFNKLESSLTDAQGAYRAVLECLERHAPAVAAPIRDSFRKDLRALVKAAATAVESQHWEELSKSLSASFKRYSKGLEDFVFMHTDEARKIMAMMAVLAESMSTRESSYAIRFRDIAKKTRMLVNTQDIALIRQRLSEEMSQLEKYVEDLERDTQQAVARVNYDVKTTQERQDTTWDAPPVDPVTNLPGNAMGAGTLQAFTRLRGRFSVALFAVENFDEIERKHGAKVGIEILKQFAPRLQTAFREPNFLCRWRQARFLLISEENLGQMASRSASVACLLSAPYPVCSGETIPVQCHYNVVERVSDEDAEQLLSRLEAA